MGHPSCRHVAYICTAYHLYVLAWQCASCLLGALYIWIMHFLYGPLYDAYRSHGSIMEELGFPCPIDSSPPCTFSSGTHLDYSTPFISPSVDETDESTTLLSSINLVKTSIRASTIPESVASWICTCPSNTAAAYRSLRGRTNLFISSHLIFICRWGPARGVSSSREGANKIPPATFCCDCSLADRSLSVLDIPDIRP